VENHVFGGNGIVTTEDSDTDCWLISIEAESSVHIFSHKNRTGSYEQDSFNMCLNFSSF
jgi:hypothetical protein